MLAREHEEGQPQCNRVKFKGKMSVEIVKPQTAQEAI